MIKITIPIKYDVLEEAIVSAWEGGSHYWAMCDSSEFESALLKKYKSEPLSIRIAKTLWGDPEFKMKVYDKEESIDTNRVLLGTVTRASVIRAFVLMATGKYAEHFGSLIAEKSDAADADIFFQLATMGEVKFG